jgi:hypothetical protein
MASQSTCIPFGIFPVNSIFAARSNPSRTVNPTTAVPLDNGIKLYLKNIPEIITQSLNLSKINYFNTININVSYQ